MTGGAVEGWVIIIQVNKRMLRNNARRVECACMVVVVEGGGAARTDGWTDGWMGGWTDGWTGGWADACAI